MTMQTLTGWILCVTLAGGGAALAGPQSWSPTDAEPSAAVATPLMRDATQPGATADDSVTFTALHADFADWSADGRFPDISTDAFNAAISVDDIRTDQHPLIPLPPSLWAGLTTLAFVAYHTIKQQRTTRARR